MSAETPRGARTLAVVALLAGIYLAYSPALDGELQFDDLRAIVENPAVRGGTPFDWLRFDYLVGASRPIVDLTYFVNERLSGLATPGYHLFNLAVHLGVVLAVLAFSLVILRRLGWPAPFATAWLAAALFGLHPLQSQAVAYICQRAEVLAALFYLLALLLALRAMVSTGSSAWAAWLASVLLVLLGWETKPTVSTFPAVLLLCGAAFYRAEGRAKTWVAASIPFFVLTAVFSRQLVRGVSGTGHAGFDLPSVGGGLSVYDYLLTEARVIFTYLRELAWPAGLNVDWDFPPSHSALEPRTALALLGIAALFVLGGWLWRWSGQGEASDRRSLARLAAFGIAWFFVMLAPTSSVVPVGEVIEEQRVYLASFGIFLPAAAAGALAWHRLEKRRTVLLAAALAVCLALGVALHQRSRVWATQLSLWADAAAKSPNKARPHQNLGYALAPVAPERALAEFRLALKLADRTIRRDDVLQNMAGALLQLRRHEEAIAILLDVRQRRPGDPALGTNLSIAYLESGKLDLAEAAAAQVAERWPRHAPAQHTLGQVAFARGDFRAALARFQAARALDPESWESLAAIAATQEKLGDRAAACASWAELGRSSERAGPIAAQKRDELGCGTR